MKGVGAATAIRRIEEERNPSVGEDLTFPVPTRRTARLIALTGMSSREDKRRAFEAGVDG
jgi:CheY-like chemotaxis protein